MPPLPPLSSPPRARSLGQPRPCIIGVETRYREEAVSRRRPRGISRRLMLRSFQTAGILSFALVLLVVHLSLSPSSPIARSRSIRDDVWRAETAPILCFQTSCSDAREQSLSFSNSPPGSLTVRFHWVFPPPPSPVSLCLSLSLFCFFFNRTDRNLTMSFYAHLSSQPGIKRTTLPLPTDS